MTAPSKPTDFASLLAVGEGDAPALGAPGRKAMTHGELRALVARTTGELRAMGLGPDDPVAMLLPHGVENASAFVALGSAVTTAPLNPAYRAEEIDFYLGDLGARALVVAPGAEGPAREVATRRGLAVLELEPDLAGGAGAFRLHASKIVGPPSSAGPAGADDVALVLHTSGTTARPKRVPLSQRNLAASARHIAGTLELVPGDVALNVMPLFHIHGLVAAVLASLSAGASVVCVPGFNALRFFGWLDEVKPSWYSAVPTMHQAILARAPRNPESVAGSRLRFVRSSSAALPPTVLADLEATFRCRVVEAYGMTEASHQMASNPLAPGARKPGSVGLPAGPEIAILDATGAELPRGETGEVSIRGPNVTSGYLGDPAANERAFSNGWLRTGDEGRFDEEGYLFLTGRLKELINRGGEKVSPLEVEAVLLEHPAVAEALSFGVPHDKLGEEVGAAVVLREGTTATERELRDHASARLADFKVPRSLLVLSEIPKGATGKPQRIGMAARLGLVK